MEEVEKYVGVWGEVRAGVGRCVGGVGSVLGCGECGKVWGGVGMGSKCVKVCMGCGKRVLGWGWCWERGGGGVGKC